MKKIMALILVLALAATMCACDELEKLQQVELPPLPTVEPSQEPETQVTEAPQVSEETVAKADLGSRVIVILEFGAHTIINQEQTYISAKLAIPQYINIIEKCQIPHNTKI